MRENIARLIVLLCAFSLVVASDALARENPAITATPPVATHKNNQAAEQKSRKDNAQAPTVVQQATVQNIPVPAPVAAINAKIKSFEIVFPAFANTVLNQEKCDDTDNDGDKLIDEDLSCVTQNLYTYWGNNNDISETKIYVDGTLRGTTDSKGLLLLKAEKGEHVVQATKDGHVPFMGTMDLQGSFVKVELPKLAAMAPTQPAAATEIKGETLNKVADNINLLKALTYYCDGKTTESKKLEEVYKNLEVSLDKEAISGELNKELSKLLLKTNPPQFPICQEYWQLSYPLIQKFIASRLTTTVKLLGKVKNFIQVAEKKNNIQQIKNADSVAKALLKFSNNQILFSTLLLEKGPFMKNCPSVYYQYVDYLKTSLVYLGAASKVTELVWDKSAAMGSCDHPDKLGASNCWLLKSTNKNIKEAWLDTSNAAKEAIQLINDKIIPATKATNGACQNAQGDLADYACAEKADSLTNLYRDTHIDMLTLVKKVSSNLEDVFFLYRSMVPTWDYDSEQLAEMGYGSDGTGDMGSLADDFAQTVSAGSEAVEEGAESAVEGFLSGLAEASSESAGAGAEGVLEGYLKGIAQEAASGGTAGSEDATIGSVLNALSQTASSQSSSGGKESAKGSASTSGKQSAGSSSTPASQTKDTSSSTLEMLHAQCSKGCIATSGNAYTKIRYTMKKATVTTKYVETGITTTKTEGIWSVESGVYGPDRQENPQGKATTFDSNVLYYLVEKKGIPVLVPTEDSTMTVVGANAMPTIVTGDYATSYVWPESY